MFSKDKDVEVITDKNTYTEHHTLCEECGGLFLRSKMEIVTEDCGKIGGWSRQIFYCMFCKPPYDKIEHLYSSNVYLQSAVSITSHNPDKRYYKFFEVSETGEILGTETNVT